MVPRSLKARLIIGAIIWIAIGVSAAGVFVSALFRQHAVELFNSELQGHLEELESLIDVQPDGAPLLYRPLSDPRFSQPGTGYSWQVSREGRILINSTGLNTEYLPVPMDTLRGMEVHRLVMNGPRGPMAVYEKLLALDTNYAPLRLQANADVAIVERLVDTFNRSLTASLALLALALVAAAALQVGIGLQPMYRLRSALALIRSGKAPFLPRSFPTEVQPLVDDLNGLIEANHEMVQRARAQAGNLAHGLKTPLAVLVDEAYRLEGKGEADAAGVILQQCLRMQRQIDYQMARARAAASRSMPGVATPVDATVASIVSAMHRLYAARELTIGSDIGEDCVTLCDPMDLNEMLANLIDNACKWAKHRVRITGYGAGDANMVEIIIEDDGEGLPPAAQEIVFKVGGRLDERMPGSGLGLPIVRDLAQLYGGSIGLEKSELGGVRAVLTLPHAR